MVKIESERKRKLARIVLGSLLPVTHGAMLGLILLSFDLDASNYLFWVVFIPSAVVLTYLTILDSQLRRRR